MRKVLFICKQRQLGSGGETYAMTTSGLYNSARFVSDMLPLEGIAQTKLVDVIDANDIDRETHDFHPDMVVIEALWVTPAKLDELSRLHPGVSWIVRLHSEVPFLAMEGIAMDWLFRYTRNPAVTIAVNSRRAETDLNRMLGPVVYLPNYYPIDRTIQQPPSCDHSDTIRIGCFGAVRPFKNHLEQAVAAIAFADMMRKHLIFSINGTRPEQKGENPLKNLRALFANTTHELLEIPWLPHDLFKEAIQTMDMGLQVSFTETFNIVAADFADALIPIVVSHQIGWAVASYKADPTSSSDMIRALYVAYHTMQDLPMLNKAKLALFDKRAVVAWARGLTWAAGGS